MKTQTNSKNNLEDFYAIRKDRWQPDCHEEDDHENLRENNLAMYRSFMVQGRECLLNLQTGTWLDQESCRKNFNTGEKAFQLAAMIGKEKLSQGYYEEAKSCIEELKRNYRPRDYRSR